MLQLLGGLLVLAGISGVLGASKRSANFLNISVVVCIIGLLLAFQFVGEVCSPSSQVCLQHAHVMLRSPCHH